MPGQSQVLPHLHKVAVQRFWGVHRTGQVLLRPPGPRATPAVHQSRRRSEQSRIRAIRNPQAGRSGFSDWQRGFSALVPVGNFEGGDLVLRELGLQIRSPRVRRWAPAPDGGGRLRSSHPRHVRRQLHGRTGGLPPGGPSHPQRAGEIPERYVGVDEDGEDLSEPEEESERPMPGEPGHLKLGVVGWRYASSSDASGEQSDGDGRVIAAKRQKYPDKGYSVPTKGHVD
ncbi:hypothetical protein DL768_011626 [Monosporascus sp. mg162]|nr:hypothetical protein DL768_011626 [Monosporascus sp. mg162]